MIIGIIGLALLVISWIPQLTEVLRKKQAKINIKFGLMYFIACVLLAIHAYIIKDLVFTILNILAGIMGGLTLFFSFKK